MMRGRSLAVAKFAMIRIDETPFDRTFRRCSSLKLNGSAMRNLISPENVTTAFELPGQRIVQNCGVVRGIVVRSRSIVGNFVAGLQTIVGGNISAFTSMCEQARSDAFHEMLEHGAELGANAIVGMRYDANEISDGVTEVLAYGTAVVVEPVR